MGIKSTALLFGTQIRLLLTIFATVFVFMLLYSGVLNQQGLPFYLISVLGAAGHLVWQLLTVDLEDPKSCWR